MDSFALDPRAAWNAGAEAYSHFLESGGDYYRSLVHGPALLEACGDVRGLAVLDLGCGQGYFSRLLARAGAVVNGVELSDQLVARATELEAADRLGITYHRMDAAEIGDQLDEGCFDLVTGCMSLQDMSDPRSVLAGADRVLRAGGRTVFSVPHPCTDPPHRVWQRDGAGRKLALGLDRYFESGPAVCDWSMPRLKYTWKTPYHRFTLGEWSGLIRDAGFGIRGLSEPRPAAELVAAHPDLDDCARMPYFLIFDLAKSSLSGA